MPTRSRTRRLRLLAAAAVAAGLVVVAVSGARPDAEQIRDWLVDSCPLGPAVFVLSMWLLQPLGPPGFIWMVPAGVVWSWPVAAALSWLGNMGASSVGFGFARWAGRDWVVRRLPPRMRAVDSHLGERGVGPIIVLRLATGQLAPADWALGVSSVRWRTFLVGTALGIIPGILMAVIAGGGLAQWILDRGPVIWVLAVLGIAFAGAAAWVIRRRMDRAAPPAPA